MRENHDDIAAMAKVEFAGHRIKKGPGLSWRMWDPKKGGIYSFRVTWTPGHLIVTGDIGHADYCVWPSFSTLWGAIELAHGAGYDYLTGKTGVAQVYDEELTIQEVLRVADDQMKYDDFSVWKNIVDEFEYGDNHRNGAIQMKAASRMRSDGLPEHKAWELAETSVRIYPPETRWCYEALQLWCRTMLAKEPAWHRAWRWSQRKWVRIKRLPKDWRELHHRPVLFEHDPSGRQRHITGRVYARVCGIRNGKPYSWMAEVVPLVMFGRVVPGWWKQTGCGGGGDEDKVEITESQAIDRIREYGERSWIRPELKVALSRAQA